MKGGAFAAMLLALGVVSAPAQDAGLERWKQLRAEMVSAYSRPVIAVPPARVVLDSKAGMGMVPTRVPAAHLEAVWRRLREVEVFHPAVVECIERVPWPSAAVKLDMPVWGYGIRVNPAMAHQHVALNGIFFAPEAEDWISPKFESAGPPHPVQVGSAPMNSNDHFSSRSGQFNFNIGYQF